jgi:hypothetical protein
MTALETYESLTDECDALVCQKGYDILTLLNEQSVSKATLTRKLRYDVAKLQRTCAANQQKIIAEYTQEINTVKADDPNTIDGVYIHPNDDFDDEDVYFDLLHEPRSRRIAIRSKAPQRCYGTLPYLR